MTTENETVNDGQTQPASNFRDTYCGMMERLEWAEGAIVSVMRDPELDEKAMNTLAGAHEFLDQVGALAAQLWQLRDVGAVSAEAIQAEDAKPGQGDHLEGAAEDHEAEAYELGDPAALEYYAHLDREASGNISAGTSYDDLTLRLSRADAIVQAIDDVVSNGESRDIAVLTQIARSEIAAAERVCRANGSRWNAGGAA